MGEIFGDIEPEDAFDIETVIDPTQMAIRLQAIRHNHGIAQHDWSGLTPTEQLVRIAVLVEVLAWLREEGAVR